MLLKAEINDLNEFIEVFPDGLGCSDSEFEEYKCLRICHYIIKYWIIVV